MLLVLHFHFLLLKTDSLLLQAMVTMALGAILETLVYKFWLLCACTFLNSFGKWAVFQITLVTFSPDQHLWPSSKPAGLSDGGDWV